jgi:hypothetical protein
MFADNHSDGRHGRVLVSLLVATLALLVLTSGGVAAQTANENVSTTENGTTAAPVTGQCEPEGPPRFAIVRMHLEDKRIESGDPAKISLQESLQPYYECPVTVLATITAPDGVEVKVSSGGTVSQIEGGAQAMFRIDPTQGGTLDESSIEVYYDGPVNGEERIDIDANLQAYPTDHRDQPSYYTDLGGLTESITVTEQATPQPTTTTADSADDTADNRTRTTTVYVPPTGIEEVLSGLSGRFGVVGIIALVAIVGIAGVARSN